MLTNERQQTDEQLDDYIMVRLFELRAGLVSALCLRVGRGKGTFWEA